MKHVDVEKLVAEAVPLAPSLNTRKEKLLYLAKIVESQEFPMVTLYHMVEDWSRKNLISFRVEDDNSVFGIALNDLHLREAGLTGRSVMDHMNFFEVSQHELHEYSCN